MAYTPTYPVAGQVVTLDDNTATGDLLVYEFTAMPSQSALSAGLLLLDVPEGTTVPTSPQEALEDEWAAYTFTPDVAGEYTYTLFTFREVVGSPAYVGDPSGDVHYELSSASTGNVVQVGELLELKVITDRGDGASLRLTIVQSTIRVAAISEPVTELGRVAALKSTVVSALAALVGQSATAIGSPIQTAAGDLLTQYEAHRIDTGGAIAIHDTADAINVCSYVAPGSQETAIVILNDLREQLMGHLQANGLGAGAGAVHPGGIDATNWPIVGKASTLAEATVLFADLSERCYELHRVDTGPHGSADTTNAMTAPSLLALAIVAYLNALAAASPTAPVGEVDGAVSAAHRYGFNVVVSA